MKDFLHLVLQPNEEIFVVLNPSRKDREKQCFLILSLLSHNLTGMLTFSQNRVSKASNLIAWWFWYFQITLLMPSIMAKASMKPPMENWVIERFRKKNAQLLRRVLNWILTNFMRKSTKAVSACIYNNIFSSKALTFGGKY